ncbi:hypothetical protein C8R44DRAFT_853727 [Mycena epipterygia]|nr:hypothetical protein C8R44DRAFT_853727 [Mycena epipterygia]
MLWKFVTMHSSGSPKDHSPTVESFLRRSQDQLITFALYLRKTPLSTSPLGFYRILHAHASRVRTLRFTAANFPSLASHLAGLWSLSWTSLEHHEAVVRSNLITAPGSFTAVSRAAKLKNPNIPSFVPAAVPTWPPLLDITTFSFMYSSQTLYDIFLIVEMAHSTLQDLKLYFQNRHELIAANHWQLGSDGPRIDFPELHSLSIGFHHPLSLVPFLRRVRLPALESLSIHDFNTSPELDTPNVFTVGIQLMPPPNLEPFDYLLFTILDTIPSPLRLTSLRLAGLDVTEITAALEVTLGRLGPHLRTLYLSDCTPQILEVLGDSLFLHISRWKLEHLTVRGMGNDDLLEYLWARHTNSYPRLKVLSLTPYTRPASRETLEQFAEVINVCDAEESYAPP